MSAEKKFVMSIDSGSTGIRAMLFNRAGEIVERAYQRTDPVTPEPGALEHDPEMLWQSLRSVVSEVLSKQNAAAVGAIGVTNQRGSFCLWEKATGKPVTNFISWADVRSADVATAMNQNFTWRVLRLLGRLLAGLSKMMLATSMLKFRTDHATVRLKWALDRDPALRKRCEAGEIQFGTLDTFFIYRLTAGRSHLTDTGNAAATGMFNPFQLKWNDILEKLFQIPLQMMPEVRDTSGDFGTSEPEFTGGVAIPIRGAAGDQMAALFGQRCLEPGQVKISQGSGAFVDMNVGGKPQVSRRGLLPLVAWTHAGKPTYMLEGYVATAGTLLDWLGRGIGLSDTPAELNQLAGSVRNTEGVLFFPTPTGIQFPYQRPDLRATILGLSLRTQRPHVARAVLEGIALLLREILDGIKKDTGIAIKSVRVDGGVSRSDILLQCIADFTGITVERAPEADMSATGAAYFAGLGSGFWASPAELPVMPGYEIFEPKMSESDRERKVREWRLALKGLLKTV